MTDHVKCWLVTALVVGLGVGALVYVLATIAGWEVERITDATGKWVPGG